VMGDPLVFQSNMLTALHQSGLVYVCVPLPSTVTQSFRNAVPVAAAVGYKNILSVTGFAHTQELTMFNVNSFFADQLERKAKRTFTSLSDSGSASSASFATEDSFLNALQQSDSVSVGSLGSGSSSTSTVVRAKGQSLRALGN